MGNCTYPGIGLGVGSGFDYLTRNVTIWLWQDGVDLDLAREAVYELIGENVGSATITGSDKVLTGQPAIFSAANSMPAFTSVSYSWDLNDDGIFETDTGVTSQVTTSFNHAGNHVVHVKATRANGAFNTASRTVAVMLAPLSDEPGVSILDGSARTSSLNVTVNMVWPAFATAARISNDGAFAFARTTTVPLAESFSWSLEDAGSGIYSTTIYVRFVGPGIDTTRTYVDSIVLDRSSAVTNTTVPAPASQSVEATATATATSTTASVSATSIHTLSLSTLRSGQNPSGRVLNAKAKVCRIVDNKVVVLKTGICRLNVTVRAPKGRKTSSVVTISCTNGLCRRQQ
jgi:PKD repeat protein